jgi:hypothetical protein
MCEAKPRKKKGRCWDEKDKKEEKKKKIKINKGKTNMYKPIPQC